jgi:cyclic pyranopterin phosphate synthase
MAQIGVWRLRLTGGEPLLRPDIVSLIARFSTIPGIRDLALSTNGEYLPRLASDLKRAGLQRINISLDSLDPKRFKKLTLSSAFDKVWNGILRSIEVGLKVKINAVALRGISREEIDAFARLAFDYPLEVRFIEFMPLCGSGWSPELLLPIDEIRSQIAERYETRPLPRGSEVAESYELVGGSGRVGYIASMTEPFCQSCSRIRISVTGKIQLCLFSSIQYDLLPTLRRGASLEEIQEEVCRVVLKKPKEHPFAGAPFLEREAAHGMMRAIGG